MSLLAQKCTDKHASIVQKVCHSSSINNKHEKRRQQTICKWSDDRNNQRMTPWLHIAEVATYQQSIITDMMKRDQHSNQSDAETSCTTDNNTPCVTIKRTLTRLCQTYSTVLWRSSNISILYCTKLLHDHSATKTRSDCTLPQYVKPNMAWLAKLSKFVLSPFTGVIIFRS